MRQHNYVNKVIIVSIVLILLVFIVQLVKGQLTEEEIKKIIEDCVKLEVSSVKLNNLKYFVGTLIALIALAIPIFIYSRKRTDELYDRMDQKIDKLRISINSTKDELKDSINSTRLEIYGRIDQKIDRLETSIASLQVGYRKQKTDSLATILSFMASQSELYKSLYGKYMEGREV